MAKQRDWMVSDYATCVAFAWDRLSITDGGDRMIPAEEMAARVSKVLGRVVSREDFLACCQTPPEDAGVVEAIARVLEVEIAWLMPHQVDRFRDRPQESEVARQLDVDVTVLRRWKDQLADEPETAFPGNGRRRTPEDEVGVLMSPCPRTSMGDERQC